jgi:hypothetical protein
MIFISQIVVICLILPHWKTLASAIQTTPATPPLYQLSSNTLHRLLYIEPNYHIEELANVSLRFADRKKHQTLSDSLPRLLT